VDPAFDRVNPEPQIAASNPPLDPSPAPSTPPSDDPSQPEPASSPVPVVPPSVSRGALPGPGGDGPPDIFGAFDDFMWDEVICWRGTVCLQARSSAMQIPFSGIGEHCLPGGHHRPNRGR
jgi:hypothetical protein